MKRNLLDMVQEILSEMDSDEVNSIDDTVESQQVANIIKSCYLELMSGRTWDHLKRLGQLDAVSDLTHPTYLKAPENMRELIFFNYDITKLTDTRTNLREVHYRYPDEFLRIIAGRNTSDTRTEVITDYSGIQLFLYNDTAPTMWTSFDDKYVVCDSYDRQVDDTLQASKTQIYAMWTPTWVHLDDAIPDLPAEAFSLLIEEAKSTAMLKLKQMADQKAEQKSKRQQQWLSRRQWTLHGGVRYPNYGRKGRR